MTKVIIALTVVLAVVLLAIGGIYAYQKLPKEEAASASEEMEDSAKSGKGPLTRMKTAENPSDIPGLLTYAMEKSLDAVGWLDIPGTDISNVVMQGMDNAYYERRNEDGDQDIYGCYFLDMECSMGGPQDFLPNTVIYGHSDLTDNPDGPRFSQLFRFVDDGFARDHKYLYVTTMEGRYTFEIFSVFYTDTSFDYIRVHMTPEETLALANEAVSRSIRDYGIQPEAGDRLLTLSTCSVREGNDGTHRFVVMGRRINEEPLPPAEPSREADEADEAGAEPAESGGETPGGPPAQAEPQQPQLQQPMIGQPELQQPDLQGTLTPQQPAQPVMPPQPELPALQQPVLQPSGPTG